MKIYLNPPLVDACPSRNSSTPSYAWPARKERLSLYLPLALAKLVKRFGHTRLPKSGWLCESNILSGEAAALAAARFEMMAISVEPPI